jgi:hypothetical protein
MASPQTADSTRRSPQITPADSVAHRAGSSSALEMPRAAVRAALRRTYTSNWPLIPSRAELPLLLNRRGLHGCGVEIGVKRGDFSEMLLLRWRGRHLVSVDPWSEAGEDYDDLANVSQDMHDGFYREARARLEPFGPRSTIWRMTGDEAAKRILHHSLDFVYIDARHDYESVTHDLRTWYEKVRPGGVMAGHDYLDGAFADGDFGVRSAVREFFAARGLHVTPTFADPPWRSWVVLTPAT